MKIAFYLLVVANLQCGLGDPIIGYNEPPTPLSMKDVERYVMDTSKVLEELAKEHMWLLSRMTGTNNWKDLLGQGQLAWRKERVTGESSERKEGDNECRDEKAAEHQGKEDFTKDTLPQPVEVQSLAIEAENSSQAKDEALDTEKLDAITSEILQELPQLTARPIIDEKLHPPHSHSLNSNRKQLPQITNSLKPGINPKIGYTTEIGDVNHPDPRLNYLALKDKPIQHHLDPYGKPIKESEQLQTGSEVSKPLALDSPRVVNTQERDVVFSPLSLNKQSVQPAGNPIPSKTPTPVAGGFNNPESANPLARTYNTHQVKPEANTLPKGIYNPLALDSSYPNDIFDDFKNVVGNNIIAETNSHSTKNHFQSGEPDKDPLDFPVQYYKPESLPDTHTTPYLHPAHHSRLEDNDIGW